MKTLIELVGAGGFSDMPDYIYAARHGQCPHNRDKWLAGMVQVALTSEGLRDALRLRQVVKREPFPFDLVYTTNLIRARHTCEIALNIQYPAVDKQGAFLYDAEGFPKMVRPKEDPLYNGRIVLDDRLEEREFGFYKMPRDTYDVTKVRFRPENGESIDDVYARVVDFAVKELPKSTSKGGKGTSRVALFIHGGSLGMLKTFLTGKTLYNITNGRGCLDDKVINTKPGTLYVFKKNTARRMYELITEY